jgi:predicted metal-dependent phosphoesterase TrpH
MIPGLLFLLTLLDIYSDNSTGIHFIIIIIWTTMKNFLIDTHVHTAEISPCGKVDAETIVSLYKQADYDAIIITDHFSNYYPVMRSSLSWKDKVDSFFRGYELAAAYGKQCGLIVLPGLELSFDNDSNDYLVYGISKLWLYGHKDITSTSIKYFSSLIADTSAIIIQAHPYRRAMKPQNPAYIHGLEIYNANKRHNSWNGKALKYAEKFNLLQTSGSDFHQVQDCARGGLKLHQTVTSIDEFIVQLKTNSPGIIRN